MLCIKYCLGLSVNSCLHEVALCCCNYKMQSLCLHSKHLSEVRLHFEFIQILTSLDSSVEVLVILMIRCVLTHTVPLPD